MAAATATAQTGAMVMTKGRIVSLFECETRSNARKTMSVPYSRRMNANTTAVHRSVFTVGQDVA
jgi:hypothetical protein